MDGDAGGDGVLLGLGAVEFDVGVVDVAFLGGGGDFDAFDETAAVGVGGGEAVDDVVGGAVGGAVAKGKDGHELGE